MPVKNEEGFYLPLPIIEGKYVKNVTEIIKK